MTFLKQYKSSKDSFLIKHSLKIMIMLSIDCLSLLNNSSSLAS